MQTEQLNNSAARAEGHLDKVIEKLEQAEAFAERFLSAQPMRRMSAIISDAIVSINAAKGELAIAEASYPSHTVSDVTGVKAPDTLPAASAVTVINDGTFQYAVTSADLKTWQESNGKLTAGNYEKFCEEVDPIGGLVGSEQMVKFCEDLINSGADTFRC